MHQAIGAYDLSAIHLPDTLMPKANAQHRDAWTKMSNQLVADPGVVRRSRARRDTDFFGLQLLDFVDASLIIPADD
jgi:hypothetical protein